MWQGVSDTAAPRQNRGVSGATTRSTAQGSSLANRQRQRTPRRCLFVTRPSCAVWPKSLHQRLVSRAWLRHARGVSRNIRRLLAFGPIHIKVCRVPYPPHWRSGQWVLGPPDSVGNQIRCRRLDVQLFQLDLADALGVSVVSVSNRERGLIAIPEDDEQDSGIPRCALV